MSDQPQNQSRVPSVMEDPSAQAVARVYADAFLQAAGGNAAEQLEEFTSLQDDVLARQPEFAKLLTGGVLSRDESLRLIDKTIAPHGSELFTNFLRVLARHGRLNLLPSILKEAHVQYELAGGKQRVIVTSAIPLSDEQRQAIYNRLQETLRFEPVLILNVDPKVLGGLLIQVGDTVYDTSLRARLNQLRSRLRQRSLNEIQSRRDSFRHSA